MSSIPASMRKMGKATTVISAVASVVGTAMLVRSLIRDMEEVHSYFFSGSESLLNRFSSKLTMVFDEMHGFETNQLYQAIETYLSSIATPNTSRFNLKKSDKENSITVTVARDQEIIDSFEGSQFKWILVCKRQPTPININAGAGQRSEQRSFQLSFHKKHKDMVINSYLPFLLKTSKHIQQETKTQKIFTLKGGPIYDYITPWCSVNFDHPASFDTLAMDPKLKDVIMDDLKTFVSRKDFYRQVGKAWKRGYLFYGPPGTGKSSLIAAMANYLKFDVYDLELSSVARNSDLRKLILATANRSILVVEDIDCDNEVQDRLGKAQTHEKPVKSCSTAKKVTLGGLLNFVDGLWSSCGDERIIVFTTNHKDRLDPALLRPGRMDVHINLSYCTPCGFRHLASNYLNVEDHKLFQTIDEMIQETEVTPAEVAEQLMRSGGSKVEVILHGLIEFMKTKKKEKEEAQVKMLEDEPNAEKPVNNNDKPSDLTKSSEDENEDDDEEDYTSSSEDYDED